MSRRREGKPKPARSSKPEGKAAAQASTVAAAPGTAVADKGRRSASAVLDAAAALLAEEGAAALTTRRIAAGAGMHAGNVQYYFRTRRDLVRALLDRHIADSRRRVAARMEEAGGDASSRLRAGLEAVLAEQASRADCALFRELWAMATHDRDVEDAVARFYEEYVSAIAAVLRESRPGLAAARARRTATLLVATLEGLSVVTRPWKESASAARARAADVASLFEAKESG